MIPHTAYPSKSDTCILVKAKTVDGLKEMVLNCTSGQYARGVAVYLRGAPIQNAFPFLTTCEREFLISGLLPGEWDAMFPPEPKEV